MCAVFTLAFLAALADFSAAAPAAETEAQEGALVNASWLPNDQRSLPGTLTSLTSWKTTPLTVPSGHVIMGLSVRWTGTCRGHCDTDGPALDQMQIWSRQIVMGDTGTQVAGLPFAIHQGLKQVWCPGRRFVSGLQVETGGTCKGQCDADGPAVRKFSLICSAPAEHNSVGLYNTEKTLDIATRYWTTRRTDCPSGTFVTKLSVVTGGTCHSKCSTDGPMLRQLVLTCSPSRLCLNPSVLGNWKPMGYSNGVQEFTYTIGTSHTTGKSVQHDWSSSVSLSIENSVEIGGEVYGGKVGLKQTLTSGWAQSESKIFSSSSTQDTTMSHKITFNRPGVVWQWQFREQDTCGESTIKTNVLVVTNGTFNPPCCPPGAAVDPNVQHGRCHDNANVCICDQATCSSLGSQ